MAEIGLGAETESVKKVKPIGQHRKRLSPKTAHQRQLQLPWNSWQLRSATVHQHTGKLYLHGVCVGGGGGTMAANGAG